ncbi:dynactin subunit 4-like [Dysidea avara]|uniref:dynactin subunit 4-like n=1 Tax=Dysidea avara TaxID=196820 RepID=UPI0033234F30
MAMTLECEDRVQYACSCATFSSLVYQYFCKYCVKIRCPECATTSVDSFYCPNCFDTVPPLEAKSRKGRCKNCLKCPRCSCALSIRSHVAALTTSPKDHSSKKQDSMLSPRKPMGRSASVGNVKGDIKKLYLQCNFCQWTTRQSNIPDAKNVSEFQEAATSDIHKRVSELVIRYKKIALQDKAERDKAKLSRRLKQHMALLETTSKLDKASLISSRSVPAQSLDLGKDPLEGVAAEASPDPEPLPPNIYADIPQLDEVLGLRERLQSPLKCPHDPSELRPQPVLILGKRLRRCKGCDHILCKSEYNPSSVRFKIQQVALHSVPSVKVSRPVELSVDNENSVILSFNNPYPHPITISFHPCLDAALLKESGFKNFAKVTIPDGDYQVSGIDDALFEDSFQEQDSQSSLGGNPEYIVNKTAGKLALKFLVTPTKAADDTKICFIFKFIAAVPEKADEYRTLDVTTVINLGQATVA